MEEERTWMYVDSVSGGQKGPLRMPIIKRLLRRGILQPQTHVWTKSMDKWQPLHSVDAFQSYCQGWFAYWYYVSNEVDPETKEAIRKGPIKTKELVQLFIDGEIDGMTLVWNEQVTNWTPMNEIPFLKEFLREANEDVSREEQLEEASNVDAADQVYPQQDTAPTAIEAEDGKKYVLDVESKRWMTPEEKIQHDLDSLREAADDTSKDGAATPNPTDISSTPAPPLQSDKDDEEKERRKRKKKQARKQKKLKEGSKTWIYVNGLPLDTTVEEVQEYFSKCGLIQSDLNTGEPRIKLYENKDFGGLNGDASICYLKEASVQLAVDLLDKSPFRPDWVIDVSRAVFEPKKDVSEPRKKQKLDPRAKIKKMAQEKALSWNEGEDDDRLGLRIVVLKHMFTPEEMQEPGFEQELEQDIQAECVKIGAVEKVTVFNKHPDGIVIIKFASSGSAATCVDVMHGRFFAGRKLECAFWDGTDYTYRESKEEEKERIESFHEWLEEGSDPSDEEEEAPEQEAQVHAGREMPALSELEDD